ncbi:MAG: DUF4956 domain-containing protein [Bacilli bacterium]|nr:DUF4956 domain-containing protein [Bacilli bacterium]MDD4719145.1 DUF4956 domain-containing protein [Bacilli bacterium]
MKELLYKFLYEGNISVSPLTVLTSMAIALILAFILYFTYKMTFNGVVYSKKFNISLIMLALITTMIINIIGSSVALSLGMVGALSIVRFRTAIKDPRDTAYIFWAICIGLGMGTSNYYIAVIGTVIIAIISVILSLNLKNDDTFLVIIRTSTKSVDKVRNELFKLYRACKLRSEVVNDEYIEIVYQIKMNKNEEVNDYENLRKIEGVTSINLIAQSGEILG